MKILLLHRTEVCEADSAEFRGVSRKPGFFKSLMLFEVNLEFRGVSWSFVEFRGNIFLRVFCQFPKVLFVLGLLFSGFSKIIICFEVFEQNPKTPDSLRKASKY